MKTLDRSVEMLGRECNFCVWWVHSFNKTRVALIMSENINVQNDGKNTVTELDKTHVISALGWRPNTSGVSTKASVSMWSRYWATEVHFGIVYFL